MIIIQAHDTDADVNALSFAPDGSRLASSGSDDFLKVWDVSRLADATPVWMADATEFGMSHLQYSPDGTLIFTCGGNSARVWPAGGVASQEFAHDPRGRQTHTSVMVCSTDGRYVAWTGGYLGSPARIFTATVADRAFHRRLSGHKNAVGILSAGPDGLVSGSADRWIKFWSWASGREYHALSTRGYVRSLAVTRAGDKLAAACAGTVYVWPLELPPSQRGRRLPGKPVELRGHAKATLCVDFS
ncbi:MAG: hypothetical protein K2V38_21480, partial [Gemmataceae bacterium]|nr:hypothetical protein [Gemmataceae bacterium]